MIETVVFATVRASEQAPDPEMLRRFESQRDRPINGGTLTLYTWTRLTASHGRDTRRIVEALQVYPQVVEIEVQVDCAVSARVTRCENGRWLR